MDLLRNIFVIFYFFKATKFKQDIKKRFESDFKEGGQRNWLQVSEQIIIEISFKIPCLSKFNIFIH